MRYLTEEIKRLLKEERKMAFVAGPRQVGKTTLARHLLEIEGSPQGYFNWDIEKDRRAIIRRPEEFWLRPSDSVPSAIVLDEIHKYPRWKRFLKGFYDATTGRVKAIVTGSGRLDVYQRGGDSLFGRYSLYRLHPFSTGEWLASGRQGVRTPEECVNRILTSPPPPGAREALDLIDRYTGFPEPLFAAADARLRRWRRARHHQVLREDLRDLTRIREIGLIETLVSILPDRIGSPLSLNALREDLGVAFGTVRDWIATLARLYYLFEIRPYAGRLARTLRREAKVYLFDGSEIVSPSARFENLAALHLLKACHAWEDHGYGDFELRYVRDKEKREADFLVTRDRRPYLLIEAKQSSADVHPGLEYFNERLRPAHSFQIVRDAPPDLLSRPPGGIHVAAAARFFSALP